ncbi:DNA primase [Brevinematales bacterium NS]|nr:DNA primase [Brevinematales bacterium]QJR23053.1 DNA primase [Brevinematales bacterium NS]
MIPDHIRDRILSKVSLVDVMEREGIKLVRRGRQYTALCPFHKEKTPSFSVNNEEGLYYCFGCHAKGNAITFLREYKNLSYLEAMEYLATMVHEDIKPYLSSDRGAEEKKRNYTDMYQKAIEFYQKTLWSEKGKAVVDYLFSRGLTEETIKAFRIGYSPGPQGLGEFLRSHGFEYAQMVKYGLLSTYDHKDRFAGRIVYPIYDRDGSPLAFGARLFGSEEGAKYINSPDTLYFKKSDVLYGFFQAKETLAKEKRAFIVEGYMDVIGLHQAGITSAVAPLGTALTLSQLELLKRYVDTLVLLFDGDNAGLQAASRSLDLIVETKMESRVVILPQGMDPDEMVIERGKEGMHAFLEEHAMDPVGFKWMYIRQYQMKNQPESKQIEEMFRFIQKIPLHNEQVKAIQKVASFLQVSYVILHKDFEQFVFRTTKRHQTNEEAPQLAAMASQTQAEEHERTLLATLVNANDPMVLDMAQALVEEEMFTSERYRTWYHILITERPSKTSFYDIIKEDNALYEKLFSFQQEVPGEGIMEQIYTFLVHYFQRKHHECTLKIEQAERNKEDFETVKLLQQEKIDWQQRIFEAKRALEELHAQVSF